MILLLVFCLEISSIKCVGINDNANDLRATVDVRLGCKGELGNPTINNRLQQHRRRLNVCYCDQELYRNDSAGCQMVCGSDEVNKSSIQLTECNCVADLEICRKWLCRLGKEEKTAIYCRTANRSLAHCRHAGQSRLDDFDECQCGNGGWRNNDGFCECPTDFFGPTCEFELYDRSNYRAHRVVDKTKYRKRNIWTANRTRFGKSVSEERSRRDYSYPMEQWSLSSRTSSWSWNSTTFNSTNRKSPGWTSSSRNYSGSSAADWSTSTRTSDESDSDQKSESNLRDITFGIVVGLPGLLLLIFAIGKHVVKLRKEASYRAAIRNDLSALDAAIRQELYRQLIANAHDSPNVAMVRHHPGLDDVPAGRLPTNRYESSPTNRPPNILQAQISDEPPLYNEAITLPEPSSPSQSEEAPPSYQDVLNQRDPPLASLQHI